MIDQLLGPLAVQPEKPLALRYCSSIKSFCADTCFASSRDKSCLTHVKPRRMQEKVEKLQEPNTPQKRSHADLELRPNADDDSWLFDDILAPAMGNFDDNEDGISVQSLNDICEPIYGMQGDNEEATLESLLAGSNRPSSPTRMDSSDSDSTVAVPDNSKQQKTLQALWDQGADSSNLMHSLGSLLGEEMGAAPAPALADPANELWAASAVDVLDETFKSFSRAITHSVGPPTKPKKPLGRPPLGPKPAKPSKSGAIPVPNTPTPAGKPAAPIAKRPGGHAPKMQNMKMACLPQQQAAPKPPSAQKGKCVWKQLVTYW